MDRSKAPDEEEQFKAYCKAAKAFSPDPVVIRTLDVGGDKDIPYLHMDQEENPFMGFRAVRYCLENREPVSYTHLDVYKRQSYKRRR